MKKKTTPKKTVSQSRQPRSTTSSTTAPKTKRVAKLRVARPSPRATVHKPELPRAPHEAYAFWVHDGSILHDLRELAHALAVMEAKVFAYHVQTEKNDFADWVAQVLNDEVCAAALRAAATKRRAANVVMKHLTYYV